MTHKIFKRVEKPVMFGRSTDIDCADWYEWYGELHQELDFGIGTTNRAVKEANRGCRQCAHIIYRLVGGKCGLLRFTDSQESLRKRG